MQKWKVRCPRSQRTWTLRYHFGLAPQVNRCQSSRDWYFIQAFTTYIHATNLFNKNSWIVLGSYHLHQISFSSSRHSQQAGFLDILFQKRSFICFPWIAMSFHMPANSSLGAGEWAASTSQKEQPHHERTRSPQALLSTQAHPNIHVYCSAKTGASKIRCKLGSVCEQICFPMESLNKFCLCTSPYTKAGEGEGQQHSHSCLHEPSSRCCDVVIPLQMLRAPLWTGWILAQATRRQEDCQEAIATTLERRSPR